MEVRFSIHPDAHQPRGHGTKAFCGGHTLDVECHIPGRVSGSEKDRFSQSIHNCHIDDVDERRVRRRTTRGLAVPPCPELPLLFLRRETALLGVYPLEAKKRLG